VVVFGLYFSFGGGGFVLLFGGSVELIFGSILFFIFSCVALLHIFFVPFPSAVGSRFCFYVFVLRTCELTFTSITDIFITAKQ